ncbi:MAG: serine/threonine-protein kinase [Deltaproteobacteria bacterium]|jgi:serine/threonine protein kinase/CRP-like cAMP-binding protein
MRRPEIFGKYQMLTRIASGGMAEVWLARSSSIGGFEKLLAIKRMHPSLSKNQAFISMFIDEAKLTVRLSHPNIVQVFDFGRVDEDYFMAMEYVEGVDLAMLAKRARRKGEPVPVDLAVFILKSVFDGLAFAHTREDGTIHRDVSPQNVLVSFDGHVKVSDFGIAKAASQVGDGEAGEVFGKLAYVSPEQCRGEAVDARTDIWAAGVILHELLTNQRLFARNNDYQTMEAVESGDVIAPSELNPEVPKALDELVLSTLVRDAEHRLQSAREGAETLAVILSKHFPRTSQYTLQDGLLKMFDGKLPRLVPEAKPREAPEPTRDHRRPVSLRHGNTKPVGQHTAAEIALVALRREMQVRKDSGWTTEQTRASAIPGEQRAAEANDLAARKVSMTTEVPLFEDTIPGGIVLPEHEVEIARLKKRFMEAPNLWTLVEIGDAWDAGGERARALGAYKLAAAKFAQRGLLAQAATIYRHLLERSELDEAIREEIKRLPALQGMPDADLLLEIFDPSDAAADFSDYHGIFEKNEHAVDVIGESPILSSLNSELFVNVVLALELRKFSAGDTIVTEGDEGDAFFMIGRGRVVVSAKNFEGHKIYLTSLSDGDCFGEQSYFTGEPRSATIEALEEAWVLEASRSVLNRVVQDHPTIRESLRRFYKERLAASLLAKSPLFGHLGTKARKELAERFTFETYQTGDLVIREGDHSDAFYAIKSGTVRVYAGDDEEPIGLAELTAGEIFGEIAAIEGSRRTASVRAVDECELLRLEATELNAMLAKNIEIRRMIEKKIEERAEDKLQRIIDSTS